VALSVAFSPDGKGLATAGADETVKVWEMATGRARIGPLSGPAHARQRASLRGPGGYLWGVTFSPDGKTLAAPGGSGGIPGGGGAVRLWDLATGREKATLWNPTRGTFRSVAFSPDGRTLAAGSQDGSARLWNPDTRQLRLTLKVQGGTVSRVAFSP